MVRETVAGCGPSVLVSAATQHDLLRGGYFHDATIYPFPVPVNKDDDDDDDDDGKDDNNISNMNKSNNSNTVNKCNTKNNKCSNNNDNNNNNYMLPNMHLTYIFI